MAGQAVFTEAEGRELLRLARASLEAWVRERRRIRPPEPLTGALARPLGAFVSLHTRERDLRGCIGHMQPSGPLAEEVIELAVAAGVHDARFEPLTVGELGNLIYEVSVLSPMKPIRTRDVKPGVHGLYIRRAGYSGVLLPQVATDHGWDREIFLEHTCMKAGLPPDAWRNPETQVCAFTAQVVSEA